MKTLLFLSHKLDDISPNHLFLSLNLMSDSPKVYRCPKPQIYSSICFSILSPSSSFLSSISFTIPLFSIFTLVEPFPTIFTSISISIFFPPIAFIILVVKTSPFIFKFIIVFLFTFSTLIIFFLALIRSFYVILPI